MNFWWFLLSAAWVAGVGLVFMTVFYAVTYSRRKDLKVAAEEELAEMRLQEGYNAQSFLGGDRLGNEDYKQMRTESGRELLRLERIGNWVLFVGVVLALVALIVYWKTN